MPYKQNLNTAVSRITNHRKDVVVNHSKTLVVLFSSCILIVLAVLLIFSKKKNSIYLSDLDELKYTTQLFQSEGKWGFKTNDGDVLIPAKYDSIYKPYGSFSDITHTGNGNFGCCVLLNGKWGFVNKEGKEIISPKYDKVGDWDEKYAWIQLNGLWGLIDSVGDKTIPPKYEDFRVGVEGTNFPFIKSKGKWGILHRTTGEEVVSPKFDAIGDYFFDSGVTWIAYNGRYGFVDTTGREIEIPGGDLIDDIKQDNGFIIHASTGYGFADYNGEMKIPCDYTSVETYNNGFKVTKNDRVGYIDKEGHVIIPTKYADITLNNDKYEVTTSKGFHGLFSLNGNEILLPIYQVIKQVKNGYLCSLESLYGYYSLTGEELIPLGMFDEIKIEGANYAEVKKNNLYGWYDISKKAIAIPVKYEMVWGEFDSDDDIVKVRYNDTTLKIDYYGKEVAGKDVGEWFNQKVRPTLKKIEKEIKDEN